MVCCDTIEFVLIDLGCRKERYIVQFSLTSGAMAAYSFKNLVSLLYNTWVADIHCVLL